MDCWYMDNYGLLIIDPGELWIKSLKEQIIGLATMIISLATTKTTMM